MWEIELSDEVEQWYVGLGVRDRAFAEGVARRVTYYLDVERKIITLTTFRKQRDNERREVQRAHKAMSGDRTDKENR